MERRSLAPSTVKGSAAPGRRKVETFDFSISPASPPAGVYEAKINGEGGHLRMGWAVLPGGQQVGMASRNGQLAPAPPLTLPEATFELGDVTHTAKLIGGTDDVVPS